MSHLDHRSRWYQQLHAINPSSNALETSALTYESLVVPVIWCGGVSSIRVVDGMLWPAGVTSKCQYLTGTSDFPRWYRQCRSYRANSLASERE
jgi:hypothetical protein